MDWLTGAGTLLNAVLISLVLGFIRRLITKVEKIDILEIQVKAMVYEMKDLGHLRERVAVLEAMTHQKARPKYEKG